MTLIITPSKRTKGNQLLVQLGKGVEPIIKGNGKNIEVRPIAVMTFKDPQLCNHAFKV